MSLLDELSDLVAKYGPDGFDPPAWVLPALMESSARYYDASCGAECSCAPVPAELHRCLEALVVAFGVRWRDLRSDPDPRDPVRGRSDRIRGPRDQLWGEPWPMAVKEFCQMIEGWLLRTACFLQFRLVLPGYDFKAHAWPEPGEASVIAMALIKGTCPCARGAGATGSSRNDRNQMLKAARCAIQHDLIVWDPAAMDLWEFLGRAVRGNTGLKSGRFRVGEFVKGMYFMHLHQHCHIHCVNVLVWKCQRHGSDLVPNFAGWPCHRCLRDSQLRVYAEPEDPRRAMRWLVVPASEGGIFTPSAYWRCQKCHGYYEGSLPQCPFCHGPRSCGAKRTELWIPIDERRSGLRYGCNGARFSMLSPDSHGEAVQEDVRRAVEALDPSLREVILLMFYDGLSRSEVAARLGITVTKATELAKQAVAELRKHWPAMGRDRDT